MLIQAAPPVPAFMAPHHRPGTGWRATLAVALAALVPALLAAARFGILVTPDSPTYLDYAAQLRAWPLPEGEALLRAAPAPATLFRTPGYPAVLVLLQAIAPQAWPVLLVAAQMAAQAGLAALAHRTALALHLRALPAAAAALMPATGLAAVAQLSVMTDALYGALAGGAALLLLRGAVRGDGLRACALAGLLLGLGLPVREATAYLLLGFLPAAAIAAGRGRRLAGLALVAAPVILAAALLMAENHRRSGTAMLSTSRQIVMVQAVLPLLSRGVPVYDGEDLFDRTARETVGRHGYQGIDALNARLFEAGLTAPAIAAEASARYWRSWRRHPLEMLRAMMVRMPVKLLGTVFMPVDMVAELHRQSGAPRPWFGRPEALWQALREGSPLAGPLLAALLASRALGFVLAAAAIAAPLLLARWRDPRALPLLGAWLVCGAFVGVHLPVHIEQRYLVPVVPLACLLGVVALDAAWRRRRR